MTTPLKVLLIVKSEEDAAPILQTLEQAEFSVEYARVESIDQLKEALAKGGWEIVISGDDLPEISPISALRLVKSTGDDIPFIVVSSLVDEESAIELMRTGAADYLMKDKLARLDPIVKRELFEAQVRRDRRETEIALVEANRRLRTLFDQSPFGVVIIDPVSLLPIEFNTIAHMQLGYSREEFSQLRVYDYEVNKKPSEILKIIASTLKLGKEEFESNHRTKNGDIHNIQITTQTLALIDRTVLHCIYQDITERKMAEKAITESEAAFQDIFKTVKDGIAYTTLSGEVISVNNALVELMDTPREEIVGRNIVNIAKKLLSLKMAAYVVPKLINMIKGEEIEPYEVEYGDKILEISSLYNKSSRHITGVIRDITERKNAEKVLLKSETRLKALVTNLPDVIAIMQPDGEITYTSPNIEKWFGWKPEDLTEKNGWLTVYADDREKVQLMFQKLLQKSGNTDTIDCLYLCKDGSTRLVNLTATNLMNDPVIHGILLNYHDVTSQRQAEEAQWQTEEKFRKAFDTSPDSININRLQDGRYLDVNEGFLSLTGYTRDEVIGRTSLEINIWDNPEDRTRLVQGLREFGKVVNMEAPFRIKDGSIKTCLMSANIIEVEGVTCILSITRDITDRRKLQMDIALAEEKFRKAFDTSPDCIIITRMHDGMYMDINNGFIELTGYTREDVIGKKSTEINIWANPENAERMKSEMREKGKVINLEAAMRIKDGSIKTCLMSANVIEVNGENCILSLTRDITERKRNEEAIQLQSAALNAVANAVVISDVNHNITWANPAFYALSGYSEEEALGQQLAKLIRSNVHDNAFYENHLQAVTSGKIWRGEIFNRRKNGEIYPEEMTVTPLMDENGKITNFISVKQDITEKKLNSDIMNSRLHLLEYSADHSLQELLKETLSEVENLTGSQISFYHFLDADQQTINMQVWSEQTERVYCNADGTSLHFSIDSSSAWIDCVREHRPVIHNDYNALPQKNKLPEGHVKLNRELVVPVFRNIKVVALLGVGNKTTDYSKKDVEVVTRLADLTWDMAEKKKSEQALRESELHYREIVTDLDKAQFYAHLGSWTWDIQNNQLTWSDEMFRIFGLNRSAFSGNLEDVINKSIHPEDRQKVNKANRAVTVDRNPVPLEYRIIRPDHSVRIVWAEAGELLQDEQGNPVKLSGIVQDITERKLIEVRIEAERELLHLCNQADDIRTLGASITSYLKEFTKCDAVGMRLQHADDFPYYETIGFPETFIEKENFLCQYSAKGNMQRDAAGNIILECMCGNILQNRIDLAASFYTPNGSFWTNSTTEVVATFKDKNQNTIYRNRCNSEGYESVALIPIRLHSRTFGLFQFNNKRSNHFTPIQIELLEHLANFVAIALAKLESDDALAKSEKRYKDLFEHSALPNLEEDFSEISKIFNELRQQGVSDMRRYFEEHPEVVAHCARLIKILDVNQACVDFFKVNKKEDLFTQLPKFFTDDSWDSFKEEIIALAEGKNRFECDISAQTKKHEEKDIKLILSVDPEHANTLSRVMVSFVDVTESLKAQEALRESEERFHNLVEAAPTGIFVMVKGVYAYANPAGLDILGYKKLEEFVGTKAEKIIHPDSIPSVMKRLASDILFKSSSPLELKVLKTNGETVCTESISTPVKFNGNPAVLIISYDISDRIKAEAALRESESRFRSLFQNVKTVAVQGYTADGKTIYWNEASEKLYGYTQQEAIGKQLTDLIIPPEMRPEVEGAIQWMSESHEPIPSSELSLMRKDGSRVDVYSSHALVDRPNQLPELFCIDVDLTERKNTELALQAALDEKEVLLREVHHRVKNNLASILGLLEMERQSTIDPNADNLLVELGNRIKSMVTIHEKLYRSPSLAKIDFQDYLKSFISHLRTSMQPGGEIDTRVKASNVDLSLDLAVPCGLIVNELVTNALKYGFPEGKPGVKGANRCEISVSMTVKGSAYTLQVADNGVGIPEDLDWRNAKTLGLRLITMLGEHQLGGKITLDRKAGTKFTLKFDPRHRE